MNHCNIYDLVFVKCLLCKTVPCRGTTVNTV